MARFFGIFLSVISVTIFMIPSCKLYANASTKAPSPFNVLCQPKKITSESQWRACAYRTIQEWQSGVLVSASAPNITALLQVYAGVMDTNIVVRLETVGTFLGPDMVAEYLTIFAAPSGPASIIRPTGFVIRRFTALRPIAAVTVDITFTNVLNGVAANLTVDQWFRFNDFQRITDADLTTPRYVEFFSVLQLESVLTSNPNLTSTIMTGICYTATSLCTAPGLQQYRDIPSCMAFMSSIPFYNPLRSNSNSVLCRLLHSTLLVYAPEIHCSHVGPTGGGKCVDSPFSSYYTNSPFAQNSFLSP